MTMMEMGSKLRLLGSTDLQISALGLGCWQFSKGSGMVGRFWPVLEETEIEKIIRVSLEGGINWFDTAEVYGKGQSEQALSHALDAVGDLAKDALIATKWWPLFRTASSLENTIDQRIEALHGKRIDLYQIHQPYSLASIRSEMKSMAKLLRDGKIRYAGVSNFNAKQMREAHKVLAEYGFQLVSNQVKYSMLDRRIESNGMMETAKELGMTIIAYSPLEQGILSGKFHKDPSLVPSGPRKYFSQFKASGLAKSRPVIDQLDQLAAKYQATPSQVALNWLIHFHGDTVVAIPGASKVRHAEENVGTLRFTLSADELQMLDQATVLFKKS